MNRIVAVIRRGLVEHTRRPGDRGAITQRCTCTANVLDHQTHQAETIAAMLQDAGLLK